MWRPPKWTRLLELLTEKSDVMPTQKYKDIGDDNYYLTDDEKSAEWNRYDEWQNSVQSASDDAAEKYEQLTTVLNALAIVANHVDEALNCFNMSNNQFNNLTQQLQEVSTDDIEEYKASFKDYQGEVSAQISPIEKLKEKIKTIYENALNDQEVFWKRHGYLLDLLEDAYNGVNYNKHWGQEDLNRPDVLYPYQSRIYEIDVKKYEDELTK